ncbi:MAG TPA: DUF2200 domain-containing protein [Pseudomonadales bacterium]
MKSTAHHDARIANMSFAKIYPMLVTKVERKGRTKAELHQVIEWLTGFDAKAVQKLLAEEVTYDELFRRAKLNEHASLITGTICGYRIEEIENPLTRKARYLDKLVDELAQGRAMEKILRNPETARAAKAAGTAGPAKAPASAKTSRSAKAPAATKAPKPAKPRTSPKAVNTRRPAKKAPARA